MRTTVTIEDSLFREIKAEAARSGRTLGAVIEDALRTSLHPTIAPKRELRPLTTYRGTGVAPGVDLSSNSAMQDFLDEGVPLHAMR
jgi:hypothetical protein